MPDNKHTDAELEAFAKEIMVLVDSQRELLMKKVREFHEPRCTAPESSKEVCLLEFSSKLFEYVAQKMEAQVIEELHAKLHM